MNTFTQNPELLLLIVSVILSMIGLCVLIMYCIRKISKERIKTKDYKDYKDYTPYQI